jgi:hypothetical protein
MSAASNRTVLGQTLCCAYRWDRLSFMVRPTLSQLCDARSRAAFRTADTAIRCAALKHGYHLFEIDRPWPALSDDQPHRVSPESR